MIIRTDYNSFILRQNPPVTLKDNPIKHLRPVRSWNVFRRVRKRLKSSAIYLIKELICLAKTRNLNPHARLVLNDFFFWRGGGGFMKNKNRFRSWDASTVVGHVPCAAGNVATIRSGRSPWQPIPRRVVTLSMSRTSSSSSIDGSGVTITRNRSCGPSFSI